MQIGTAQQHFAEIDLNTFVKIYMSSKVDKKRNSTDDKKIFDRYNVTHERYQQIAKAFSSNKPIALSPNEYKLLAELKEQSKLVNETNNNNLKIKCLENNISYLKYSEILNLYQKDIQFQRSLKPHFDAYIKQLK